MERVSAGRSRARAALLDEWRRQLDAAPRPEPPTAQAPTDAVEPKAIEADPGAKVRVGHREADAFEARLSARADRRQSFEDAALDSVADSEARAAQHLRLQRSTAPQEAPQNLLGTLAAQRASQVRSSRRVAPKRGAGQRSDFRHLPHQGLWSAQPVPPRPTEARARRQPQGNAPRPAQVTIS